ncbi:MAG: alpha/beta hydrolase family esterase [Candidatus Limnocylindrales bacterium]
MGEIPDMSLDRRLLRDQGRVRVLAPAGPPTGIVLCLHGSRSNPDAQARLSGMARLAGVGALVVFPRGSIRMGMGWGWDREADLPFLSDLVDELRARHPFAGRVCLAGMSGGARMACRLAAARADAVGALGAVAGLRAPDRTPGRPVAVIAFHGASDRINPYAGGGRPEWQESVPDAARAWAVANGAGARAHEFTPSPRLTRVTYGAEEAPGEVTLWTMRGAGHTWPGGSMGLIARLRLGPTSREPDATGEIWAFFRRHAD